MSTRARSATASRPKSIVVEALARVEGEGGLTVQLRGGKVQDVKLRIYEPPRFIEAFLRGRDFREVPDVTARICGICPVAYQMSSIHAMGAACGVSVGGPLRALRRLLYCGEWIESHALHVYMLHAPDFLGYESAIHMAADHAEVVRKALELKKTGNDLVTLVGGREIHPVNVKVGGFYRAPTRREMAPLVKEFKPDVLFFTGGYVAVPMAMAGRSIPSLLYVPDIEPGMALKSLAGFSDAIAVTTEQSQRFFNKKVLETGYPLRADLALWDRSTAHRHLGITSKLPVLLVLGGSKGARSINLAVLEHLRGLLEKFEIIHISGDSDWTYVKHHREQLPVELTARYHALPYLHEMGAALAATDLVHLASRRILPR